MASPAERRVGRIRTVDTIRRANMRALVLRAVEAVRYPGTSPPQFYEELAHRISEHALGVFVGYEDDAPRALAIGMLPTSCMMMAPQIPLVYSEASRSLLRMVAVRMCDWIVGAGYDRALGANLYRADRVFMRGFSHFGKPSRIASMIEFRFD